ncbi:MAG TPA: hypothetical protein VFQ31_02255 [Methyloceanibacter sp.]|nr:hypothetical protein [Methyloceanibacter sp.]
MFTKTAVALAAATIALGAAAFSPAMANHDRCYERPSAKGCPGNYDVTQEPFYVAPSKNALRLNASGYPPPSRLGGAAEVRFPVGRVRPLPTAIIKASDVMVAIP